MKRSIEMLHHDIGRGSTFAKALASQPDVFDTMVVTTAEVGEESGKLPEVLGQIAEHFEKSNALRRKLMQALTYPALVMSVAVCAILFLLVVIVPTFAEMFKGFQVDLPASTLLVLGLSDWVLAYGIHIVVAVLGFGLLSRSVLTSRGFRATIASFLWSLPLLGRIITKSYVARISRTLGTLLSAEVSLLDALRLTQRMIRAPQIQNEIAGILKSVQRGCAVAEPLAASRIFPPMVAQMIAVGEEASELDAMLIKVAEFYEHELAAAVDLLATVIEPVLVLVLGLIVAAILVAMYLPMFDLMTVVGGAG